MDVAQYIGLFLIKNCSCFIQGLGNLELNTRPAYYDGQLLYAPANEVTFTPTGAKDDELANFMAVNEHVSISRVFDALHDFSANTKTQLESGKEVIIPAIGKFAQQNGKIIFITDPVLLHTPPPIEATRTNDNSTIVNEPVLNKERKGGSWITMVLIIIILFIFAAGGWYIYQMYTDMVNMTTLKEQIVRDPVMQAPPVQIPDTTSKTDSVVHDTVAVATPAVTPPNNIAPQPPINKEPKTVRRYEVVLKSYYTIEKAQLELSKLRSHGNNVKLVTTDSIKYLIVMRVMTTTTDTMRVLDSLSTLFNPGKVYLR